MEPLVVYDRLTIWRRRLTYGLAIMAFLVAFLIALQYAGLLTFERHSGFYAPTWDIRGEQVFYIQRDTLGVVWGFGHDQSSPPAYAFVVRDQISLRRLHVGDGRIDVLRQLEQTPASGRVLLNYRGQVFSPLLAQINVRGGGLDFMARLILPDEEGIDRDVALAGVHFGGYSDNPLAGDIELMVVPGLETYPAAVLAVTPAGSYDVLISNQYFDMLYPEQIMAADLQRWSRRWFIEQEREMEQRVAELVRDYRARGLSEDEIEQALIAEGYIPVGARIIASRIDSTEPGERIFEFSAAELNERALEDIRMAIEQPGTAVPRQRLSGLTRQQNELVNDLHQWLADGNRSFVIRYRDEYYRLLLMH